MAHDGVFGHGATVYPSKVLDASVSADGAAEDRGTGADVGTGRHVGVAGDPAAAVGMPTATVGGRGLHVTGLVLVRDGPGNAELIWVTAIARPTVEERVLGHGGRRTGDDQEHLRFARLGLEADLRVVGRRQGSVTGHAVADRDEAERPAVRAGFGVALEVQADQCAVAVGYQLDLVVAVVRRRHRVGDAVMPQRCIDGLDGYPPYRH